MGGELKMSIYTPNKTSAKLLVDYATTNWGENAAEVSPDSKLRYLMVYDLYIKARSYAIINKIAFWFAAVTGILVLIWPSVAIVMRDFGIEKGFLKEAVIQTTITAIAALIFAVYSHYKKRQMYTENMMRYVIYSDKPIQTIKDYLLQELGINDAGFDFSETFGKKPDSNK